MTRERRTPWVEALIFLINLKPSSYIIWHNMQQYYIKIKIKNFAHEHRRTLHQTHAKTIVKRIIQFQYFCFLKNIWQWRHCIHRLHQHRVNGCNSPRCRPSYLGFLAPYVGSIRHGWKSPKSCSGNGRASTIRWQSTAPRWPPMLYPRSGHDIVRWIAKLRPKFSLR